MTLVAKEGAGQAQTLTKEKFETAIIRPWVAFEFPDGPCVSSQKPKATTPGNVLYSGLSLRGLVMAAYGLTDFYQLSGPSGINTKPYTLEATTRPDATKEQIKGMIQSLIAERFKVTVHRENRSFELYELRAGKVGPKLRKSVQSPNPCIHYASASMFGADVGPAVGISRPSDTFLPASPGVTEWRGPSGPVRAVGGNITMPALADYLSGGGAAGRLVIDKTGLAGEYDFNLDYEPGPALLTAVEEHLGLKMTPARGSIEVLVVDQFQPTPVEVP